MKQNLHKVLVSEAGKEPFYEIYYEDRVEFRSLDGKKLGESALVDAVYDENGGVDRERSIEKLEAANRRLRRKRWWRFWRSG